LKEASSIRWSMAPSSARERWVDQLNTILELKEDKGKFTEQRKQKKLFHNFFAHILACYSYLTMFFVFSWIELLFNPRSQFEV